MNLNSLSLTEMMDVSSGTTILLEEMFEELYGTELANRKIEFRKSDFKKWSYFSKYHSSEFGAFFSFTELKRKSGNEFIADICKCIRDYVIKHNLDEYVLYPHFKTRKGGFLNLKYIGVGVGLYIILEKQRISLFESRDRVKTFAKRNKHRRNKLNKK